MEKHGIIVQLLVLMHLISWIKSKILYFSEKLMLQNILKSKKNQNLTLAGLTALFEGDGSLSHSSCEPCQVHGHISDVDFHSIISNVLNLLTMAGLWTLFGYGI